MRSGLQGISHIPTYQDTYWQETKELLGWEQVPHKAAIWKVMGYRPLPHVWAIHESRATHRIVGGGNRGGKTYMASSEVVPYMLWPNTTGWVVSKNYSMADQLRLEVQGWLTDRLQITRGTRLDTLKWGEYYWSPKNQRLQLWNGSRLDLKSVESPDSMHAVPVDYIIIDEAALCPFFLYDNRLIPRLIDSGGWILSIGTFEFLQGEWFEEYFDIGQGDNDLDIASFMMPTTKNFHIYMGRGGEELKDVADDYHTNPKKVMKGNPDITWPLKPGTQVIINNIDLKWLEKERKRIDPRTFEARYLAKSAGNQFRVFPDYNISTFVDKDKAEYDPDLPVFLAIDPGGTYAVAVVQFKTAHSLGLESVNELSSGYHCCIIDEIYLQTTTTTHEIYDIVTSREWFSRLWHQPWEEPYHGCIDVMAPEQRRTWERKVREEIPGFRLRKKKVGVAAGVKTLQYWLDMGSLWVHPRARWFSTEMKRYHYKEVSLARLETGDPRAKKNPVDSWNHLIKALIYLLVIRCGYWGKSKESAKVSREKASEYSRKRRQEEYRRRVIHG